MIHNFLTSSAIVLGTSDVAVPKHDETIIFRHSPASSPNGSEPTIVLFAAFLLVPHQCRHTQLDVFFVVVPVVLPVGRCLLHQDVLTLITEVFHLLG